MPAARAPSTPPRRAGRARCHARTGSSELAERVSSTPPEWFSRFLPPDGGARESAVLILFGPPPEGATDEGEHVVLIERSHTMRTQPAQIAFPGGARDLEDDDLVATALREAQEEVGLDPSGVDVLAVLPSLFLSPANFVVAPVLGWWSAPVADRRARPGRGARRARRPGRRTSSTPGTASPSPTRRATSARPSSSATCCCGGSPPGCSSSLLELGGRSQPWDPALERPLPQRYLRRWAPMTGSALLDIALILLLSATACRATARGSSRASSRSSGFFLFALVAVWQLPAVLERWGPVGSRLTDAGARAARRRHLLRLARPVPRRARRQVDPSTGRSDRR